MKFWRKSKISKNHPMFSIKILSPAEEVKAMAPELSLKEIHHHIDILIQKGFLKVIDENTVCLSHPDEWEVKK